MREGQEEEEAMQEDLSSDQEHAADIEPKGQTEANASTSEIDHEALAKENYDRYLRTVADFENYKKRTQKEQGDLLKYANERILLEILPIIDNFTRALSASKEAQDFEKMVEGVEMIQKQFLSALDKFGVRQIESLNQNFDPFQHQAVGQAPIVEGSGLVENQVVAETQTGYFLNDRVLRPSLVIVAKKAERPEINPEKEETGSGEA